MIASLMMVSVLAQQAAFVEARPVTDALVTLIERSRAGETLPRVAIFLDGGPQVSGIVTDLSGNSLAVLDAEIVHFVDVRSIIAVSIPANFAIGAAVRAPSKVDVQRRAEDLARGLTELLGGAPVKVEIAWKSASAPGLADSGEGLAVLAAALDEAAAGVRASASDDASRRDLARRLKRIRFTDSPRAGVSISGDTLSIGVAPGAGSAGRVSAWEVRRALASP